MNHTLVPLSYRLKGGDQIEVLTSTSQHPQQEWLEMVTTAKAKNCLNQYFRREERHYIKHGERLVDDAIQMDKELAAIRDTSLARLLNYYHITHPQRGWRSYIPFMGGRETANAVGSETAKAAGSETVKPKKGPKTIELTDDELGKKFILSTCCHPIPGDDVLGYQDEKGLMHIHKIDCPEANLLKTSYGKRIYSATWNTHRVQSFVETIEVKGIDKFGVFINVMQIMTQDFHINMRAINISSEDGIFKGTMEIYVYDRSELEDLLKALRKIDNIKEVKRYEKDF